MEPSAKKNTNDYIYNSQFQERMWLKNRGKAKYIQFDDDELKELRKYFNSLDGDGSGSIGVEELEDPLIALGLAKNTKEVAQLIKSVDDDGSGQIEFNEFLSIMSSDKDQTQEKSPIFEFFKKMINGDLMDSMDKNLPFKLNVSQYRRKKILDAIMNQDPKKREIGNNILQNFKKLVIASKQDIKIKKGENPNEISIDRIPNDEKGVNTRNGIKYIISQNSCKNPFVPNNLKIFLLLSQIISANIFLHMSIQIIQINDQQLNQLNVYVENLIFCQQLVKLFQI